MVSCKDDTQDPNPNRPPSVSISAPSQNASYDSGTEVPIVLTINHDASITSYKVTLRDRTNEELVFFISEFSDSREIVIDTSVILQSNCATTIDIAVMAEDSFDNELNEIVQSFTLNPPVGNTFGFRVNLQYDGETLLMNKQYEYPTGQQFEFSRFDMFISNLKLIDNGQETLIKDIDFLAMTNTYKDEATAAEGYIYKVAGLDDGNFDTVVFNIGLTPEMNATTPSDYPVSHPLGQSSEYWDGWVSYIFASIEGRIDLDTSNPNFEQGMALHLGSNEARQEVSLPITLALNNNETKLIDINIDLRELFIDQDGNIYDVVSTPQTHNLIDIPMVIELAQNLKKSIKN